MERGVPGVPGTGPYVKVKRLMDNEIRWVEERFLREDGGSNPIFTGTFGDIDLFAQKVDDVLAFPGLLWDNSKNIITGLGTNVNVHLHNLGLGANERTGLFVLESEQNPNKTVTVQDMILKNIEEKGFDKVLDIMKDIIEATRNQFKVFTKQNAIKELFTLGGDGQAGSLNGISIPGNAVIVGVTAGYSNPIVEIPMLQYNVPTAQHMGVGEFECSMVIHTDSLELVRSEEHTSELQ